MKIGLAHHKQKEIGNAIQRLLVEIDSKVEAMDIKEVKGVITIASHQVSFDDLKESNVKTIDVYQSVIN